MAFVHTEDTVVTLGGDALSAFISTSSFKQSVESHDLTTYGTRSKVYRPGMKDATFSMEGWYDSATGGPKEILEDLIDSEALFTLIRQVEGAGSGKPQESVSAMVTSYDESSPVGEYVKWSAELQCSGAISRTPQA